MKRVNKDIIHDSVDLASFYPLAPQDVDAEQLTINPDYFIKMVGGTFYLQTDRRAAELQQKAMFGIVLSIVIPASVGPATAINPGRPGNIASGPPIKRQKPMNIRGERLLICGDGSPQANSVFCVPITSKFTFFNLLGQQSIASEIALGDMLMFYESKFSQRTMSNGTMAIMEAPRAIVILKRNLALPEKPIMMSADTARQIHFVKHGCTAAVAMIEVLIGPEVPCNGPICDRQLKDCKGCPGQPKFRTNWVLSMQIEIENQRQYNASTGIAAFCMRSFRTTCMFIKRPSEFGTIDLMVMKTHQQGIRGAAAAIVDYVNGHGGWTVIGWHRRGVTVGDDGAPELNAFTKGHVVRFEPTNLSDANRIAIEALKYNHL